MRMRDRRRLDEFTAAPKQEPGQQSQQQKRRQRQPAAGRLSIKRNKKHQVAIIKTTAQKATTPSQGIHAKTAGANPKRAIQKSKAMNVYDLAEIRRTLNRNGREDWNIALSPDGLRTVVTDCNGTSVIIITGMPRPGNMLRPYQWRNQESERHYPNTVSGNHDSPATCVQAALDWFETHPNSLRPTI